MSKDPPVAEEEFDARGRDRVGIDRQRGQAEAKLERKNRTADPMAPTEMNFTP